MNRRHFVRLGAASAGAVAAIGCDGETGETVNAQATRIPSVGAGLADEAVLDLAETTAQARLRQCHHCAQATFMALEEVFGLQSGPMLKALTPIPGIAERGEACGAVVASLLALGLVYGRDRITDWEGWRRSLVPTRAFCEAFEKRFGSTACGDILELQFGKRYDLYDPDDLKQFQAADPATKCGEVVGVAARLAADKLLDSDAI